MNGQTDRVHEIFLNMRKELKIRGVKEVESFDETGAVLQTECGELSVEGQDIRVNVLDVEKGEIVLCGRIDGIFYSLERTGEKRHPFFKRER
jgi:sporulation protein YabP